MNDQLLKQLIRQMKILNFWITLFGSIVVVAIIVLAILIFQVIQVIQNTNQRLENVKNEVSSSLDVQEQACTSQNAFGNFLRSSGACE